MVRMMDANQANDTLKSLARFLLVGMLGTLVDLSLFAALHVYLEIPALVANTVSYSAGIVNNYLLHRRWTFSGRPSKAPYVQFAQFVAFSLCALALNTMLVLLLSQPFGSLLASPDAGSLLAKIFATCVGLVWNFLANHYWTFRKAGSDDFSRSSLRSDFK